MMHVYLLPQTKTEIAQIGTIAQNYPEGRKLSCPDSLTTQCPPNDHRNLPSCIRVRNYKTVNVF